MSTYDALLQPFTLKHLTLRNRVMSTSHAPSYGDHGMPGERYQLYHLEKAKGGIGLTMFGGSASVAIDSPATPWNQLDVSTDAIVPYFQQFAGRIHDAGAALMCQITHMGRRTRWDIDHWITPISASAVREPAHRAFPKIMEDHDIRRVQHAYALAAQRCQAGNLDGCEVLFGGHLPMQFLSPRMNRRTDDYGGSLDNRLRFILEMLHQVRAAVGPDFIVGARITGDEFVEGGIDQQEGLEIAKRLAASGLIDYFNVNGGDVVTHRELAYMIPNMAFPEAPYLYLPSAIRQLTGLPVFHAGRIASVETAARAIEDGHLDLVAMTRAHIADPHIVNKLKEGRVDDIRPCVGASYCIDRIYVGKDALCIQNPATGRERTMPHVIPRSDKPQQTVVVVGAGPAGLEAARVAALRGHRVVLFEQSASTGGQINLAAKAGWRQGLAGITRWLEGQVQKLGVDLRLNTRATAANVQAEQPDIVIIASGGKPNTAVAKGHERAVSTWDILSGEVTAGENVLVYDEQSEHQALSCAEFLATRGAQVELVTADRMAGEELGSTNFAIHLRELYNSGVVLTPDQRLTEIYPEGNRLVAVLRNEYTLVEEERVVDQVVIEHGTLPVDELYFALKPLSLNLGELDVEAFIAGRAQTIRTNPVGAFQLFRIGDASASRNIHAALYDALRLCKEF